VKVSPEVMIGNFAIARGLVEAGLELAAAYPGTPSSEILPGVVEFNRREKGNIHAEWSTNERCAMEVAFGAALSGRKAVCMMKQVGLNVAFPPLLRGRGKRLEGALVIVCCDDPGPQSSQTEQDTRLLCALFDIPVFDPASPKEAGDIAYYALEYSFRLKTPVIVRSTHRVSHAREAIELYKPGTRKIRLEEGLKLKGGRKLGIVTAGMSHAITMDVISGLGLSDQVSLYKVVQVFPLRERFKAFVESVDHIVVVEETDSTLEMLMGNGNKVFGRANGYVPGAGELTYDVVRGIVERIAEEIGIGKTAFAPDLHIEEALQGVTIPPRPPKLCAGCSHRASFHAMSYAYPEAIFPGDIGCYTLGIAQGAVDTCIDMGGGVTLAAGFYDTFTQDSNIIPILASVGDSTFFHACLPPLYDAVQKRKKFTLVILDNSTTAMTGMQPTPQSGVTADGSHGNSLKIEDVVEGFGVQFVRVLDPYDLSLMMNALKDAQAYLTEKDSAPAVIIAKRACLLSGKGKNQQLLESIDLEEDCTGCKTCITGFGCPALSFDEEKKKVKIDDALCIKCGICLYVCPRNEKGKSLSTFKGKRTPKRPAQN
jgi:indolepyruvate ferredoxin oxidoreductase, alpha subunit